VFFTEQPIDLDGAMRLHLELASHYFGIVSPQNDGPNFVDWREDAVCTRYYVQGISADSGSFKSTILGELSAEGS
jgi:hypothetical protein